MMNWYLLLRNKKLKYYETQKLFYGKFLYKVSFYNDLNNIFRTEFQKDGSLGYAREKIDQLTESYRQGDIMTIPVYRTHKIINEKTYLDARHIYACLIRTKDDYKIRVDAFGQMNIFSNSFKLIEKLAKGLKSKHIGIYQPDKSIESKLLKNSNIVISNNPVDWPIKVTLGNRIRDYSGFANWIEHNKDKIKIGEIALRELGSHGYVSGYYFFIKNEKMLNLITIMIGDNIRRIDHVIYKGNIDKY